MNPATAASAAAISTGAPAVRARPRIQSVDILRGLVMIVMALDHVRDFFHYGAEHFDPTDLTQTTPILFFTRWITHFCAPTFMFLAGTGAYLQSRRGKSTSEVAHFLWTRGLWLVVLELTWVRWFGWRMNFGNDQVFLWVIWALGVSMIALAGLIFIPWRALLVGSLAVILLHNAFDGITPAQFGPLGWLWKVLHVPDSIAVSQNITILTSYPLIPWIFVMAAGYCFGRVMDLESEPRRRLLFQLGGALIAGFVVLRWSNLYGDMSGWSSQSSPLLTIASFLNCTKYPPSLLYLLMTVGPGIFILGLLERVKLKDANPLIVFGRVPLFYYMLHIPLIHGTAILLGWFRYGRVDFMLHNPPSLFGPTLGFPADYGYNLAIVYVIWIGIVVALYPACRWFAGLKQRNRSVVLSYF
jgi:uncharacterized membrane protein